MSAKNVDRKGRRRSETIAFRVSPAERKKIADRVQLCGYQTKQDFILNSILYQQINAIGNPLMLVKFRQHLISICDELGRINEISEVDDEFFTPIRTMLEILENFKENDFNNN